MLARIKCWLYGHLRGKKTAENQEFKTYRCPRCKATWTSKVYRAPAG